MKKRVVLALVGMLYRKKAKLQLRRKRRSQIKLARRWPNWRISMKSLSRMVMVRR